VWKVQGCDTLYSISRVTGVSLEAILSANPEITNPDIIFPGQLIRLPGRN
jgi:LysM repeat protein